MFCGFALGTKRTKEADFKTAVKELELTVPNFPEGFNLGTWDPTQLDHTANGKQFYHSNSICTASLASTHHTCGVF